MAIPKHPIHLDALLASARVLEEEKKGHPGMWSAQEDLPLEKHTLGTDWVWKASQLTLHPAAGAEMFPQVMVRSYPLNETLRGYTYGHWEGKVPKRIPQGSGTYKGYNLRLNLRQIQSAEAYCVGDPEQVEDLLRYNIRSLGASRRNGWGRVTDVRVDPCTAAATRWRERMLPQSMAALVLPGHHPSTIVARAPYWRRSNWEPGFAYAPMPAVPEALPVPASAKA